MKKNGFTSTAIQRYNLISMGTIETVKKMMPGSGKYKAEENGSITTKTLDTLCKLSGLQPGDLLEYVEDEDINEQARLRGIANEPDRRYSYTISRKDSIQRTLDRREGCEQQEEDKAEEEKPKRGPGRPRKYPKEDLADRPKRGRGRPRKNP